MWRNRYACCTWPSPAQSMHCNMIVAPSSEKERGLPATFAGVLRGALSDDTKPIQPEKLVFEYGNANWAAAAGKTASTSTQNTSDDKTAGALIFKFADAPAGRRRGLERRSPSQLEGGSLVDLTEYLRLDTSEALNRGTLVHSWFEKITWLEDGIPADEVLCEIGRLQGFSEEKLQHLLERFRHSLENPTVRNALSRSTYADKTLKDEAARDNLSCVHLLSHNDLNSPRWEVRQELPFAVDDGEGILAGAIDRLVILYDGDRPVGADIIDFKTDAVSLERPEGIENRVDVYRPQIEAYRRAAVELTGLPADRISARLLFSEAGCLRKP